MERWLKKLGRQHRELLLYAVFGVMTFLVDTGLFFLFSLFYDLEQNLWLMHGCSICSTMAAITFAYFTNRRFVFKSNAKGVLETGKEILAFYSSRVFAMVLAELLLQVTVSGLGFPARWMKLVLNLLVIVLNYLFSKFWIFKSPKKRENKPEGKNV